MQPKILFRMEKKTTAFCIHSPNACMDIQYNLYEEKDRERESKHKAIASFLHIYIASLHSNPSTPEFSFDIIKIKIARRLHSTQHIQRSVYLYEYPSLVLLSLSFDVLVIKTNRVLSLAATASVESQ